MKALRGLLAKPVPTDPKPALVLLDFKGIEIVNASYLRGSFLWLFTCGQVAAGIVPLTRGTKRDPWIPFASDVFPFVVNTSKEILLELDEVMGGRDLPYLMALRWSARGVESARLGGKLDGTLKNTLSHLLSAGPSTAEDLYQQNRGQGIKVTAWNNRLFDLYSVRLAKRTKRGKHWVYEPIAKEIKYG